MKLSIFYLSTIMFILATFLTSCEKEQLIDGSAKNDFLINYAIDIEPQNNSTQAKKQKKEELETRDCSGIDVQDGTSFIYIIPQAQESDLAQSLVEEKGTKKGTKKGLQYQKR